MWTMNVLSVWNIACFVLLHMERLYGMVDELQRDLAVVKAERGRLLVSDAEV
jgi:hypothetical protein